MSINKSLENGSSLPLHVSMEMAFDIALHSIRTKDRRTPTPYLVSVPGIGKTEFANYTAKNKNVGFISFMMGLKTYDEVSCLPYIHTDKKDNNIVIPRVEWIRAEFLEKIWEKSRECEELVVFFDDFHLCSQEIQKICNEIFTSHSLHGHQFPDNCSIFAAGNDSSESGSFITLSTVMNRMQKLKTHPDKEYWLENFAIPVGLNSIVTSFISRAIHTPYFCEPESTEPTGSPRSWTYLANSIDILKEKYKFKDNYNYLKCVTEGSISKTASKEFMMFYSVYSKVPTDEIFKTGRFTFPTETEKYAFIIAITDYIISEIISSFEQYELSIKKYPNEIKSLFNKVKIFDKIIEKFIDSNENELCSVSMFSLINHPYKMEKNNKKITFFDIVHDLMKNNILSPKLINLINIQIEKKKNFLNNYSD